MKDQNYVLLKSLYYDHRAEYDALYDERYNSPDCTHLNFKIAGNPAFFVETPSLYRIALEITRINTEISELARKLPPVALNQYINKSLIDEIVITNNIEGVYSTRKEIGDILDNLEEKSEKRFYGLVNKYHALMSGEDLSITSCNDIRKLYDEMFLLEVISEDPNDAPDGEIFRKGTVDVVNPMLSTIHKGLYPESEIVSGMENAIVILNDASIEPLFRISIFHYLFGYIHPFYNGNGRISRFISSFYLTKYLEPIMGYRLSYTIKENLNRYYKSFKIVNEEINKGDITPFIYVFLGFIKEAALNLKEGLAEKYQRLNLFSDYIKRLPDISDEELFKLYFILLQASLFSDTGISTQELLDLLGVSRPTLQKKLNMINNNNLLITAQSGQKKLYKLNIKNLRSFIEA